MPFEHETMPIIAPILGYAYVPIQQAEPRNLYSAEDGLMNGTIFPVLHKPLGVYGKETRDDRLSMKESGCGGCGNE